MESKYLGDDLAYAAMRMAQEMARRQDEEFMHLYAPELGRSIWRRPIWVDVGPDYYNDLFQSPTPRKRRP
jgi:hypothetical protein